MRLKCEEDIMTIIQDDEWMMDILQAAKSLNLPDWWVCAGFVRSKIWDTLSGFTKRTTLSDVDVVYYDLSNINESVEKMLEDQLQQLMPDVPWSVKNEARMHLVNGFPPYTSAVDAIMKFPETATALGVKLNDKNQVVLTAPCGIEDVLNFKVRPTPYFRTKKERALIYEERISKKNWKSVWKQIQVEHLSNV